MTLTKKQRVIIWTFVVLIVILLGFNYSRSQITFYGYKIAGSNEYTYYFYEGPARAKYLFIGAFVIIGATLLITSKKK